MRSGQRSVTMALAPLLLAGCSMNVEGGVSAISRSYGNVRYTIEGEPVQLADGVAVSDGPAGSASKVVTRYYGDALQKDLNGDGREDVAVLLAREGGGSGTFYYVAAALRTDNGYLGSHALPLGDRIVPRGIFSAPGRSILVSYAERAPGEPLSSTALRSARTWSLSPSGRSPSATLAR